MEVRLLDDRDEWNAWALGSGRGNLLQSYEWGEFKASFGWQPVRLVVEDAGQILAGAQLLMRRLPMGTVAYAPRGPLVDFSDARAFDFLLAEVHRFARQHGAIALKIEPETSTSAATETTLLHHGFIRGSSVQPRSTIVVDLSTDVDTIASRLNNKTRYNIGLAGRKGVAVREGSASDLPDFYHLLVQTSQRSGFSIHDQAYYEAVWSTLAERGMGKLLIADYAGSPLAAAMVFASGTRAYYMYSASSSEHRNLKPNDFLQWECIKWAHSAGCRSYDLWGIPDEIGQAVEQGLYPHGESADETNGRAKTMWGVYRFKRGFGGEVVRYAGAFDYVYSRARYWLYLTGLHKVRPALTMGAARRQLLEAS